VTRIAILGAGLAGLTAAYRLLERGIDVEVFEHAGRVGGQLLTAKAGGFVVEQGAEGYVARSEALPALARAIGMESQILEQRERTSYRFEGGALRELGPGEAAAQLEFQVAKRDFGAGIKTFRDGMGSLTEHLAAEIRERAPIHLERGVRALAPEADGVSVADETRATRFDGAIVALTSAGTSEVLREAFGEVASVLSDAATLSSVTVSLAYSQNGFGRSLNGTGCVLAEPVDGCRAMTFTSAKFEHRSPDDAVSLRVFFRPVEDEIESLADGAWVARARHIVSLVLGVRSEPCWHWVSRWDRALPVFSDAHHERAQALVRAVAPHRIRLAGSALFGSGIDAAVRSAEAAASDIANACGR
jgi:protoporphyrinogen/coproporphyrinogen III oxidase